MRIIQKSPIERGPNSHPRGDRAEDPSPGAGHSRFGDCEISDRL